MAEYIEREAAFNAILKLVPKVDGDGYCWVIRGDAAAAIDALPAADVVERASGIIGVIPTIDLRPVVLCKDCRHRDPEDHKCDSGETERQGCLFKVADDYFCAYGER